MLAVTRRDRMLRVTCMTRISRAHQPSPRRKVATKRARAAAAWPDLHSQLAAVVEYFNDAIFSRRLDGVVTTWNAAAERIFGFTADEIIG